MDGVAAGAYGANTGVAVIGDAVVYSVSAFPAVFDFSMEHGQSLSKRHRQCLVQTADVVSIGTAGVAMALSLWHEAV
jgi:hypothetical protein